MKMAIFHGKLFERCGSFENKKFLHGESLRDKLKRERDYRISTQQGSYSREAWKVALNSRFRVRLGKTLNPLKFET
jgi:hypothetical protein